MNYGEIKKFDIANGIGIRVSLFVSGCRNHCPDCFNKETWDFNFGNKFTSKTEAEILNYMANPNIKGLTILGGEPLEPENQRDLLPFFKKVKQTYPEKDIWCFTGFVLETEILGESRANCEVTAELLQYIDILVDGRYEEDKKNISLQFRGSENQRVIDLPETLKQGKVVIWSELRR